MAKHNISEASSLVNKNRKTLQRYMKSGKLSYKTRADGQKEIDTSELIRVFGETTRIKTLSHNVAPSLSQDVAGVLSEIKRDLKELRRENRELKKDNNRLHGKLDDALKLMLEHKTNADQSEQDEIDESIPQKKSNELGFDLFDIPSFIPKK